MALEYAIKRLLDLQETNFEVLDIKVFEKEVVWTIKHKEAAIYKCPNCGKEHKAAHDFDWIRLWDVPIGIKKSRWHVQRARIACDCSWTPVVEDLPFRSKQHYITKRLQQYIEELLCTKMLTVADVARIFDLDYGVIYKIDHEVLLRLMQKLEIPDPVHISVDEKSFLKGHKYVTIVTDCDLGKVIWVSEGNRKESLDQFFEILGPERCANIKTVAKDLHQPYSLSVKQYIPHATEIADKFHVIQRLNQAIDESRRELSVGSFLQVKKRKFINNMQWVLRYKKGNMSPSHIASLDALSKINEPLYKAYLLKEKFFHFFLFKPSQLIEAKNFLIAWVADAFKLGLSALKEFALYLSRHSEIIINIIREKRTSAISEGINRKITVLKSMAYGYRNLQYFRLKIMQRCGVLGYFYHSLS